MTGFYRRLFRSLVFHPGHLMMRCRRWRADMMPRDGVRAERPALRMVHPWQFASGFRQGDGSYATPYGAWKYLSTASRAYREDRMRKGPFRKAVRPDRRSDPHIGYVGTAPVKRLKRRMA